MLKSARSMPSCGKYGRNLIADPTQFDRRFAANEGRALEGTVVAETVVVREGGMIKGHMRTTNADIQGIVEGEVVVDGLLDVKSTGQVTGDITYGQFSVQVGGVVAGQFNGLSGDARSAYVPVAEIVTPPDPDNIPNGDGYDGSHTQ